MSDSDTPMTDKANIFFHDGDHIGYVRSEFARRLERIAAQLAEALAETHIGGCSCSFCAAARNALATYNKMKEENQ